MLKNIDTSNKEAIKADTRALKEDVTNITRELGARAEEKYTQFKEKGKEMSQAAEEQAYRLGEKAKETFNEASVVMKDSMSYIDSQAKTHPYVVAGLSFLFGMPVARFGSNSRKD